MSSSKEVRKARIEKSKSSKASSSKANEALSDIDFYSEDSEDFDDHGDDFRPKRKKRNFEFTESAGMFRLLKMFIFMQMIALLSDHTSIKLPLLFTLLERGILYYVVHFYSRPLMDVVYIVQYFFAEIHSLLQYLHLPSGGENSKIEVSRKLGNSNYASVPEKPIRFGADFAFLDPKSWHTIQMFSHYFLGIMFFILALLFTLKFWEISDYTNRDEVRKWLHQYVADGWSRRGGLNIAIGVCKACLAISALALGLFAFSREFTTNAFPEPRYIGTCLAMITSTTFCVWLIGFQFLKATESAFTRYVSQNVSYTSSIILKRVVKSKTELAISLIILLFMPVAYNLVMALTMVTDWNDNWAMPHRVGVNFYVPCYLMAFPPYRESDRNTGECPVYYSNSPDLPITSRRSGYYKDHTILSCDSYFGISIFTLSLISLIFVLIGFFWIIYRFQKTVVDEFVSSRWVSTVVALITIKDDEEAHYVSKFSFVERYALAMELELRTQFKHLVHACRWVTVACFELAVDLCKVAIAPVLIVLAPFFFLADRIFVLVCNDWSMEGRRRKMRSQLREADDYENKSATGSFAMSDERTVDTKSVSSMQRILNENQKLLENDNEVISNKSKITINSNNNKKKEDIAKSRRQRKLEKIMQYDEEAIAVDHHIRSIPEIILSSISHFLCSLPCVTMPASVASKVSSRLQEMVMRSDVLAQIKLTLSSWKRYIVGAKHSKGINVADIGGAHAPWRISTKLIAKCRSIRNLHRRINEELRRSRMEFIMDHQLTICIFDTVMDSSGLFFLVNNFQWYRLSWIMVIILEMAVLSLGGAYLNFTGTWQEKIVFFVAIITVFGVITYMCNPFTDDTDKWLDFLGRILVCSTGLSIVICDLIVPGTFYEQARTASVFRPWDSIAMIEALDPMVALSLLLLDFLVVFYFFAYIYYVLKIIGVYGYFVRKVESWKFALHDRVLDFLVEKVDERTIGFENIHSGLLAIQQWDDIITNQRRYALLTWPDVRPSHLMTCMQKMVEVQWSALFNLTLENLRSSLGLSLLHTTMCAADSEISRWLIEYHQELLTAQDSQRDTPILIALKECAFYLMKFGEQNNGQLDDGTSFSDDAFNSYYPEVEVLREEVMEHGEFIPNCYENYFLDSKELQCIVSNGYFMDTRDTDEADKLPSFLMNIPKKRALTDILLGPENNGDKTQEAVLKAKQAKEEAAQRRKQAKLEAEQAYKEKLSLYCKRFPEDEYLDDFESGLMTSWKMIGLKVPVNNIFVDLDVYSDQDSDNDLFQSSGVELVSKKSVASENISQFIDEEDYVDGDDVNDGLYDDNENENDNDNGNEDEEFEPLNNEDSRDITSNNNNNNNNKKNNNKNNKNNKNNSNSVSASSKGNGTTKEESVTAATSTSLSKKRKAIAEKKKLYSKHVNQKHANIFNKELYNKYDSKWHHFFMNLFTNFENQADLEYAIPTAEHIVEIHPKQSIPTNHERYQAIKDWDYIRKSTKKTPVTSLLRKIQSNKEISDDISTGTPFSLHNDSNVPAAQGVRLTSVQDREIRYKICKFAEIFMSNEVARNCCNMKWDINAFKELNKLASLEQGQLAQNLAMVLNLNPPDGFARISEWTLGLTQNVFDDVDEVTIPLIVRGALAVVSTAENVTKNLKNVSKLHKVVGSHLKRVLPSGSTSMRRRQQRTSSDRISGLDDQQDNNNNADGEQHKNHSVAFSDRTIYYLSECLVASRDRIELKDAEISVYGRKGWRAIMRALRRRNTTFVIPSTFMGPKPVVLRHLILPRNELDDGDCVLLSEIILYQQGLMYLDLNHNRIATRGFNRLCRVFKSHESITTIRIDSNRIGPAAGKSIGIVLKFSKTLKILSISNNYLGPMVRFPTPIHRQKMESAARDIFVGLRSNHKLEVLDLSYNHLGPILGEVVPSAVNRHPKLTSLNLAGNDIGNEMGIRLTFALAGRPGAHKEVLIRQEFYRTLKERAMEKLRNSNSGDSNGGSYEGGLGGDISHEDVATMIMNEDEKESNEKAEKAARIQGLLHQNGGSKKASVAGVDKDCTQKSMLNDYFSKQKKASRKKGKDDIDGNGNDDSKANKSCQLSELLLADNELGYLAGYGLGELIKANKSLTVLDVSNNSLGNVGGVAITDALEKCYGIQPRDFFKNVLEKIEESKYVGRDAEVKKKLITNLTVLKLSRNGLGSNFASGIMTCLADPNCTLIDVDISDNPLGVFIHRHGDVIQSGLDTRLGLGGSKSLLNLNLSRTSFMPTQLVPVFGGMAFNRTIRKLIIQDVRFDEPTALQCAHAMEVCESLHHIDFLNCNMGPRGGVLIVNKLDETRTRITYANLSGNKLGPVSAAIIGNLVTKTDCAIRNLYLANNDFLGAGGEMVIRGLAKNASITDIDLSSNALDASCGEALGIVARGLYIQGRKVSDCALHRLVMNDNPDIGSAGARALLRGLLVGQFRHVELSNIGAGPSCASIVAKGVRDVALTWEYFDLSGNNITRPGMNEIFWALRQNRRIRVIHLSDVRAGPKFGTDEDALLKHGVSVVRCLRANVIMRELDLSFNGLSSGAGINILDGLLDNYVIKKVSLRGNTLDDDISEKLAEFLRYNNVIEELDLGDNRLGYDCCFSIAEGMEWNRSIRTLLLDKNELGNAGTATLSAFVHGFTMNCNVRVLNMDSNKLGPLWGDKFGDIIARNATIVELSLRDNHFDQFAARKLVSAYEHSEYLRQLALSKDEIGLQLWDKLREIYRNKLEMVHPDDMNVDTEIQEDTMNILKTYM